MNWKKQILKNHKGQTGFFKEIEKKSSLKAPVLKEIENKSKIIVKKTC